MNYAPVPPPRSRLAPVLVTLGVLGAVVAGSVGWVLKSWASVGSELEAAGYSSPAITMNGPFTFAFSATKGASTCSGTITHYPGSSSREETCFDTTPPVPPPSNRSRIEKSLARTYGKFGFARYTCPDVADADDKTTCTLAADNGTTVTATVERTKVDRDGSWGEWTTALDASVGDGETIAAELTKSVGDATKRSHPQGVDVDCGRGPFVFKDAKATCDFTTRDKKPKTGKVELTAKPEGGYTWKATL